MKNLFLLLLISNVVFASSSADSDYRDQCFKNACTTNQILVETSKGLETYDHITLEKNCRLEIDYFPCDHEYYLRDPQGKTKKINDYLADNKNDSIYGSVISVVLQEHFIEDIYDCRAITKSSWKYIYEKKIHKENESICISYKMKAPFIGEIKDCGAGREHVLDTVNYSPNMITMKNAAIKACNFMVQPENKKCEVKAFEVYTNKKSTYYDILISKNVTPTPNPYPCIKNPTGCSQKSDNEYPVFEVDAFSGEIRLKKILKESPKRYDVW